MNGDVLKLLCLYAAVVLRKSSAHAELRLLQGDAAQCALWLSGTCVSSLASSSDFFWAPSSWGLCDTECGSGMQKAVTSCFARNFTNVLSLNCAEVPVPEFERLCNAVECPVYTLYKAPWTECRKTCGAGHRTRQIFCRNQLGSLVQKSKCAVEDTSESETCNVEACGKSYWGVPRWSACDAPCGGGRQKRNPLCLSDSQAPVCTGPQPSTEKTCNTQPCQTYSWLLGPWKPCPYLCGAATSRLVQCVDGYGFQQSDSKCYGDKPSSKISCEQLQTSCDDCLYNCHGNGACQEDTCVCYDGWSGRYCQTPSSCKGFMGYTQDGKVECCKLVDIDQKCCNALLDKDGMCCDGASLDSLGVCNGNAVMIDAEGKPCLTIRDEKGLCCYSGFLDECHVCDGDGTSCSTSMTLQLNVSGYAGAVQDADDVQLFFVSTMKHLAVKLNVADEALALTSMSMHSAAGDVCKLDSLASSPCVENDSLNAIAIARMTVLPTRRDVFARREDVMAALQPGLLSPVSFPQVLEATLLAVNDIQRTGMCGNGICERSERCTSDGTSATTSELSCCFQDCPYVSNMCPAPIGGPRKGEPCSNNGVCFDASGQCDCFRGYGGPDCSECLSGWMLTEAGVCVMLPDEKTFSKLASSYREKQAPSLDSAVVSKRSSNLAAKHRRGIDVAGKIILLVLTALCMVLFLLMLVVKRIERRITARKHHQPPSAVKIPEVPEDEGNKNLQTWKASPYIGSHSDYDVIPITPMVPRATIADVLKQQTQESDASTSSASRPLFCSSRSVPLQLELPPNPLTNDEDFTEAEQSFLAAKVKEELRKGKSATFVTNYLTDSDSEEEVEHTAATVEFTPDSPAIAR